MSDLLKNPLVIVAGLLIVAALVIGTKSTGPTYAVASGPTAADIKARAEGQATFDAALNAGRADVLDAVTGYAKTKLDYSTSITKIRTDADVSKYQTDAGVKLGLEGLASAERNTATTTAAGERNNQRDNQTAQQNGILGFFGNLFGAVIGLFV